MEWLWRGFEMIVDLFDTYNFQLQVRLIFSLFHAFHKLL
jgi:hypothetical protein